MALGSIERGQRFKWLTGHDLDPVKDLAQYLRGEFQLGAPIRITNWRPDATGQTLTEREVSRLEVLRAMALTLTLRQRRVLWLLYVDCLPWDEACARLHIASSTLAREREGALTAMVPLIYAKA